jgi:hypothetical protein
MNDSQRLQLQNMIQANNVEDQTELIRQLKHSEILRRELNIMMEVKSKYTSGNERTEETDRQVYEECIGSCTFLFTYYTDIFNKIRKDEIDVKILNRFLDVLKQIEDGELDQHTGSFLVGTILKELYIDSALKKAEKLDELNEETREPEPKKPEIQISWKQFKNMKD